MWDTIPEGIAAGIAAGVSPEGGDFVLGEILVALEAVLVGVEDGQTLVRQHLRFFQLGLEGGKEIKNWDLGIFRDIPALAELGE